MSTTTTDTAATAREYVRLARELADLEEQAAPLRSARDRIEADLRAVLTMGEAADAGDHLVVMAPPLRRPAARVSADGADAYREELLGMGLGHQETVFRPPTAADVRARAGDLIAAGVPLERILPDPGPGTPVLQVVPKAGAS